MQTLKKISLALTFALAAASAAHAANPTGAAADFGSPAAGAAGRVIELTAHTRHINVAQGEVITLKMGEQSLTWHVSTYPHINAFPLARIAPQLGAGPVVVYVAASQTYQNG